MTIILVLTLIIILTVTLGISYIIVTKISHLLKKNVKAMRNISEGDGDLTVQTKVRSNNELGQMNK